MRFAPSRSAKQLALDAFLASCSPKLLNSLHIFAYAYSRQYASIPDLRPFSIVLVSPGHTMGFRGLSWATLYLESKTWASKMDKRITLKPKVVQRIWICQLCFASFSRFSTKSQRGLISEELSKALRQLQFCSSTYFWYTVLWILMVVLLSWLRIVRCSNWLPTKPELRVCDLLPFFFEVPFWIFLGMQHCQHIASCFCTIVLA